MGTIVARGTRLESGVAYGRHERKTLDIYTPARDALPACVIFFYGGGFATGSKRMYGFVGSALAGVGITTIVPDYRLRNEASTETSIQDAAEAVHWSMTNVAFERFVLIGHSAGAFIAATLALGPGLTIGGEGRKKIKGLVGLAGPFGGIAVKHETLPETLLLSGGRDRLVPATSSAQLTERIRSAGGTAAHISYPRATHATLIGSFSPVLRFGANALGDSRVFIERIAYRT